MLIQVQNAHGKIVSTVQIDVATPMVLILRPCFYCDAVLVAAPRKFCCDSHRVYYCRKDMAHASR